MRGGYVYERAYIWFRTAPPPGASQADIDSIELFREDYISDLHRDIAPTRELEYYFRRAVVWFTQFEEWGEAAFPYQPKLLSEQPWEWVKSIEAVRAAKTHFMIYMKSSPQEQMEAAEGGIGRGAVGDSL